MPEGSRTRHWGRVFTLIPLALLVVSACSQAAPTYTGVQPRTAIEKIPSGGDMKNFQLVATNPLISDKFNLPRGMGGGITAIRDCLYAGSSIAQEPTLVLDMKDMTKPTVVGALEGIPGKGMGIEAIEGVADLNLLVNTARNTKGWGKEKVQAVADADKNIGMVVYDATDCRKPTMVAKVDVFNDATHYMSLWRDPVKQDRVLASISYSGAPDGVDIRVWDLTGCPKTCSPKLAAEWGLRAQLGIPQTVVTKFPGGQRSDSTTTHDHTFSLDGKRIHLAQTKYGYLQIDSSLLASGQPCTVKAATSASATGHCLTVFPNFKPLAAFGTEVANVHGVIKIPGRPYVALQHEGHACPFGAITMAYVGDQEVYSTYDRQTGTLPGPAAGAGSVGAFRGDLFPRNVGTFSIPEQNADRCPKPGDQLPQFTGASGIYGADVMRSSKTVHNVLAFPNIMFATWYGGGLRAIDISNPNTPFELGYFFNKPVPEVRWCSEGAAGPCADPEVDSEGYAVRVRQLLPPDVFARSYPIAMNGHIVYYDENSGIYVLKYTGPRANEIPAKGNCISRVPNGVNLGFEPCAPYK